MIVIDGQNSDVNAKNFGNLEELLVHVASGDSLKDRIVTDVLVNNESFSEVYPHQAEDISLEEVKQLEIRSIASSEFALNIASELGKVLQLMESASRTISELFRSGEDTEALEMYQDLIDVTRDFLGMVSVLRNESGISNMESVEENVEEITGLFSEMIEVSENEDWILLADLLEFEFQASVGKWQPLLEELRDRLQQKAEAA